MADNSTKTLASAEETNLLRDVEVSIYVILDMVELDRREFAFTGMQERTHSRFTLTLASNPGHNFSHEDYMGFLCDNEAARRRFAPIFGEQWAQAARGQHDVAILSQGVEIGWKNHRIKVPSEKNRTYAQALLAFQDAYNRVIQVAELTMARTVELTLANNTFELLRLVGGEIQRVRKHLVPEPTVVPESEGKQPN